MTIPNITIQLPIDNSYLFSLGPEFTSYNVNQELGGEFFGYSYDKYREELVPNSLLLTDRLRTEVNYISPRNIRLIYFQGSYRYELYKKITSTQYRLNVRGTNDTAYLITQNIDDYCYQYNDSGIAAPIMTQWIVDNRPAYELVQPNLPTTTIPNPVLTPVQILLNSSGLTGKKHTSTVLYMPSVNTTSNLRIQTPYVIPAHAYGARVQLFPQPAIPVTVKINGELLDSIDPFTLDQHGPLTVEIEGATNFYLETAVVSFYGATDHINRYIRPISSINLGTTPTLPAGLNFVYTGSPFSKVVGY